jgi:hypothetical protein
MPPLVVDYGSTYAAKVASGDQEFPPLTSKIPDSSRYGGGMRPAATRVYDRLIGVGLRSGKSDPRNV